MTTSMDRVIAWEGVYGAQEDSRLIIDVLSQTRLANGRKVADLCTGSGVVAIEAARQGAAQVRAFDICPRAVRCARANSRAAAAAVAVHLGSISRAVHFGPYDTVVCNPPYVPFTGSDVLGPMSARLGPARAWNGGHDGRLVLNPLLGAAPELLVDGGTMLVVHSEFCGVQQTLDALQSAGLHAYVVAEQWIPFGPVLTTQAQQLERTALLQRGRRWEKLVTVRADKSVRADKR